MSKSEKSTEFGNYIENEKSLDFGNVIYVLGEDDYDYNDYCAKKNLAGCKKLLKIMNPLFYLIVSKDKVYNRLLEKACRYGVKEMKGNFGVTYLPCNKVDFELLNCEKKWQGITVFQEGQILIRHPFKQNMYLEATIAEQEIVQSKNILLAEVLQNLGAKSINASCKLSKTEKRIVSNEGRVKTKEVKVNAKLQQEIEKKYSSYANFQSSYSGVFDSNSYDKALELCNEFHFSDDEKIMSLVRQRNPNSTNLSNFYKLEYSASSELNCALDFAFNVAVLSVGNSCFKYKKNLSERYEITTSLEVMF